MKSFTRWLAALTPVARPRWRPTLTLLEDRSTPATFSGNTITLDVANETLTIATNASGTYRPGHNLQNP